MLYKRMLTGLLSRYQPPAYLFGLVHWNSFEIRTLKAIYQSPAVRCLSEDCLLPIDIVEAIQMVITQATHTDANTAMTLKAIFELTMDNQYDGWEKLPANNKSMLINLDFLILVKIHEFLPKKNEFFAVSRRLFQACKGQNAWLNSLLNHVVRGELDRTECILTKHPDLSLQKGKVTDHANRSVYCTAFQYALWAGDWHLYPVIQKHMSKLMVSEQVAQLNQRCLGGYQEYGPRFSFADLLTAYDTFGILCEEKTKAREQGVQVTESEYDQLDAVWLQVAKKQFKLPIHVLSYFFHHDRSDDDVSKRSLRFVNGRTLFEKSNTWEFAVDFGLLRAWLEFDKMTGTSGSVLAIWSWGFCAVNSDKKALMRIEETIQTKEKQAILKP